MHTRSKSRKRQSPQIQSDVSPHLSTTNSLTPLRTPTAVSSNDKSVSFSVPESQTIVDSSQQQQLEGEDTDGLVEIQQFVDSEKENNEVSPLVERIPSISSVLMTLKSSADVINILNTPKILSRDEIDEFEDAYFEHLPGVEGDFWEEAWAFMFHAVVDNIPESAGQVKKCKDAYFLDVAHMLNTHFFDYLPPRYHECSFERRMKLRGLGISIVYIFVEVFEMLLAPPKYVCS